MDTPRPYAVLHEPACHASEAAHILGLPSATVRAWSSGQDYAQPGGTRQRCARVIEPAELRQRLLSFANLCELHLLSVIRRRQRVQLPQVRKAVAYMQKQLGEKRPLLSTRLRTNGVDLLVESAGQLLDVSKQGQQALHDDFKRALDRVDFNPQGVAVRLFPITRNGSSHIAPPGLVVVTRSRQQRGQRLAAPSARPRL